MRKRSLNIAAEGIHVGWKGSLEDTTQSRLHPCCGTDDTKLRGLFSSVEF